MRNIVIRVNQTFIIEILDIVDDHDEVIGSAPRPEVYEKKLRHRIVHILLFNKKGEMAIQLRSKTVGWCPSHWSTAVGGHVMSGESYGDAALRECQEELGTDTPLDYGWKDDYLSINGVKKFLATFKADYEGPFHIDTSAVERIDYFSLDKIQQMVDAGEKFHPELLFLLTEHCDIKNRDGS